MTTTHVALVAALEKLNALPDNATEDDRAKALLRVGIARDEILTRSSDDERASLAPMLAAMSDLPDMSSMVQRTGRYSVEDSTSFAGMNYRVYQHNDVVAPNVRRMTIMGLAAWIVLETIVVTAMVFLGANLIADVIAGILATLVAVGFFIAWIADERNKAITAAKNRVAEVHDAGEIKRDFGVDMEDIGLDHPDLAQWLLDYVHMSSSTSNRVKANMKRRLRAMVDSPLSATNIDNRLYELRHDVSIDSSQSSEPLVSRVKRSWTR